MIEYTTGNLFDSDAECLVNTVNCEGYMGKGIAYQFKLRYPDNNKDYVRACKTGELRIGTIHSYKEDGKLIVNFPTKNKWREKSQMYYVEGGLQLLVELLVKNGISSVAIPPLGCGNGGLNWNDVKRVIEEKLEPIKESCQIYVFEPSNSYKPVVKEAPKLNVSSLVLLQIRMKLAKFGAIRLQKTAFFMNYFLGEEYFKFDKWNYGPYSHSIDIVARGIKEYQQFYGFSNSQDTYEQAYKVLCSKKIEDKLKKLLPAVDKATEFVNKVGTDKKLEGIATVLYLVENNSNADEKKIVDLFKQWSEDKAKRFTKQYIGDCISYLEDTGIIIKNICGNYELSEAIW